MKFLSRSAFTASINVNNGEIAYVNRGFVAFSRLSVNNRRENNTVGNKEAIFSEARAVCVGTHTREIKAIAVSQHGKWV